MSAALAKTGVGTAGPGATGGKLHARWPRITLVAVTGLTVLITTYWKQPW